MVELIEHVVSGTDEIRQIDTHKEKQYEGFSDSSEEMELTKPDDSVKPDDSEKLTDINKVQEEFDETYAKELVEKEAQEAKEAKKAERRARPHRIVRRNIDYGLDVDLYRYQDAQPAFDFEWLDHLLAMPEEEYMEDGAGFLEDNKRMIRQE